jgi:hypothetical protein
MKDGFSAIIAVTSLWHDRLLLAPPLDRRLQPADARAVWRRWILTKPNSLLVSGGRNGVHLSETAAGGPIARPNPADRPGYPSTPLQSGSAETQHSLSPNEVPSSAAREIPLWPEGMPQERLQRQVRYTSAITCSNVSSTNSGRTILAR